jgi:hypothetical protein
VFRLYSENLKEEDHLEDVGIDGDGIKMGHNEVGCEDTG